MDPTPRPRPVPGEDEQAIGVGGAEHLRLRRRRSPSPAERPLSISADSVRSPCKSQHRSWPRPKEPHVPQYAALIYEPGDPDWSTPDTPEKQEAMSDYGAFGAT